MRRLLASLQRPKRNTFSHSLCLAVGPLCACRLLASLQHPNLTTFYEAFCDHGKLCIVQELLTGGDLATLIR